MGAAPDRTLFVGNLESRVREEILYELFLQEGSSCHYLSLCQIDILEVEHISGGNADSVTKILVHSFLLY
uniref:Uncharacterized protein n=1 Tax=Chelonoidis abingdonii TaxID=106734 RepID=A0A8C0IPQ9_CHEAB